MKVYIWIRLTIGINDKWKILLAILEPRVHHQLVPERIEAEKRVKDTLLSELAKRKHVFEKTSSKAVVQGIFRNSGTNSLIEIILKNLFLYQKELQKY